MVQMNINGRQVNAQMDTLPGLMSRAQVAGQRLDVLKVWRGVDVRHAVLAALAWRACVAAFEVSRVLPRQ